MEGKPKIVCVIPAYNEEKSVGIVVNDVKKYVDEVIVVNDGSTDRTAEMATRAGATVINNFGNKGLGITIKRGFIEALKRRPDIVVQTDADNQYTAEDIPKLIQPIIDNQADMVLASRFQGGIENMPASKSTGNRIGTVVTSLVAGRKISDAQTGFRAIRRELLQDILPVNKFTYTQEMIIKASKEGWRIAEIPSYFKKRDGKSKLFSSIFYYLRKAIVIIVRTILTYHPLWFFGVPGAILLLGGFILGIQLLFNYLAFLEGVSTLTSIDQMGRTILAAFLMMSGIILISIGLIVDTINLRFASLRDEMRRMKE